jgi:hypothetical protein
MQKLLKETKKSSSNLEWMKKEDKLAVGKLFKVYRMLCCIFIVILLNVMVISQQIIHG